MIAMTSHVYIFKFLLFALSVYTRASQVKIHELKVQEITNWMCQNCYVMRVFLNLFLIEKFHKVRFEGVILGIYRPQ